MIVVYALGVAALIAAWAFAWSRFLDWDTRRCMHLFEAGPVDIDDFHNVEAQMRRARLLGKTTRGEERST